MIRKDVCRILILGLFLIGLTGCSSKATFGLNWGRVDETRKGIDELVADPDRRAAMHAIIDTYVAEAKALSEEVKTIRAEIVEKNRDYDTTRADLESLYEALAQRLDDLLNLITERSMEMKELCTEEEWIEIFDHKDDLVNFTY